MKTSLSSFAQQAPWGTEANQILRACVHCGFCTAVCPTYQLLGNELDSPRGRIYLIKAFLEGQPVTAETQRHLDLCLTCRACETTCPSGVQYGRLAEIGRGMIESQCQRPLFQRLKRWTLRKVLPHPTRFQTLVTWGRQAHPLLPPKLRSQLLLQKSQRTWPQTSHSRKMLVLTGCVQSVLTPQTNLATAHILDKLGIQLLPSPAGCCGALNYHLAAHTEGLTQVRQQIDKWWPALENGAEAIVITASGCGVFVKEYGHLLRDDPVYAEKAARVSALARDICEILGKEDLSPLLSASPPSQPPVKIALHVPCTLQHGQKLSGVIENILKQVGFELTAVPDSHLCCGSAGVYSLLQKNISQRLLKNKLTALHSGRPQLIATANIGCQMHLQSQTDLPVKHWIELL